MFPPISLPLYIVHKDSATDWWPRASSQERGDDDSGTRSGMVGGGMVSFSLLTQTKSWGKQKIREEGVGGLKQVLFSFLSFLPTILVSSSGLWVLSPHHQAILWHQLAVPQFNTILTLFTSRKCQIPQVKGSVPHDCSPTSSANHHQSRLASVLLTYQL